MVSLRTNNLVKEVVEFINKDKKRPICTPLFQDKMIGLFLGSTDFPKKILNKLKKKKKNILL